MYHLYCTVHVSHGTEHDILAFILGKFYLPVSKSVRCLVFEPASQQSHLSRYHASRYQTTAPKLSKGKKCLAFSHELSGSDDRFFVTLERETPTEFQEVFLLPNSSRDLLGALVPEAYGPTWDRSTLVM